MEIPDIVREMQKKSRPPNFKKPRKIVKYITNVTKFQKITEVSFADFWVVAVIVSTQTTARLDVWLQPTILAVLQKSVLRISALVSRKGVFTYCVQEP